MYVNSSTQSPTVAVIGGGSAGSTIAIRLAMAGIHVHLIEKKCQPYQRPAHVSSACRCQSVPRNQ